MSNRPRRRAGRSKEEYPDDLFGPPLETIPLPDGPDEQEKGADEEEKADDQVDEQVGYCSPPKRTRWKKGGPSPNPQGRPKKQRLTRLAQLMGEQIQIDGSGEIITRREALDRVVLERAIKVGGPWRNLFEERKERDCVRRKHEAEKKERSEQSKSEDKTAKQLRQQSHAGGVLLALITKQFPGLLDTLRQLEEAGLVVRTEEGLKLTSRGNQCLRHEPLIK